MQPGAPIQGRTKNFLADMFGQQKKVQQQRIADAQTKREILEAEVKAERKEAAKGWFGIFLGSYAPPSHVLSRTSGPVEVPRDFPEHVRVF